MAHPPDGDTLTKGAVSETGMKPRVTSDTAPFGVFRQETGLRCNPHVHLYEPYKKQNGNYQISKSLQSMLKRCLIEGQTGVT